MHLSYSPESAFRILHTAARITRYNDFHSKFDHSMRNKGRFQFLCHQSCTQSALKLIFGGLKNQTLTSMPHFSKSCNGFTHYRSVTCWAGSLRCRRNTEIISIYHIVKHGIQRVLFTVSAILLLTFRGSFCFMNIFLKV